MNLAEDVRKIEKKMSLIIWITNLQTVRNLKSFTNSWWLQTLRKS